MTKDDLLVEIQSQPHFKALISTTWIDRNQSDGNTRLRTYRATVLEVAVDDRRANDRSITFYVLDEGEPTEAAFYQSQFPSEELEPVDKATAVAYLEAFIPNFGYRFLDYDVAQRWTKVLVYEPDPSDNTKTRESVYLLREDAEGNPYHYLHTEYDN